MAFDTYLVFADPDLKGEATAVPDGIELFSFSWGASNPVTIGPGTGGASGGRVSISSFNVMKRSDKSSPNLFLKCCNGSHIPTATVHMRKQTGGGGQADFLTYTFSEVYIESVQWSGSTGGDDTPTESLSLAFGKCNVKYQPQSATGALGTAVETTWDLTKVATK